MWILWLKLWQEGNFEKPCENSPWKYQNVQLWFMWQQIWGKSRFENAYKNRSWKNKSFECDTCYKAFSFKGNFERHHVSTTHGSLTSFLCQSCLKAFRSKGDLIVHEHQKYFDCDSCGKRFFHKAFLNACDAWRNHYLPFANVNFVEKWFLRTTSNKCMKVKRISNVVFVKGDFPLPKIWWITWKMSTKSQEFRNVANAANVTRVTNKAKPFWGILEISMKGGVYLWFFATTQKKCWK